MSKTSQKRLISEISFADSLGDSCQWRNITQSIDLSKLYRVICDLLEISIFFGKQECGKLIWFYQSWLYDLLIHSKMCTNDGRYLLSSDFDQISGLICFVERAHGLCLKDVYDTHCSSINIKYFATPRIAQCVIFHAYRVKF